MIPAGEMAGGRVLFSNTAGYMSKIRVQFLRKSSPRGVYPAHFPARQGKNVRRPISSAHFTLDVNGYPVVSPNDQGAPCCVVYPKNTNRGKKTKKRNNTWRLLLDQRFCSFATLN